MYGLASVARQEPFIRAGLMALAFCLSSAARGATVSEGNKSNNTSCYERNINIIDKVYCLNHDASELLDALGIIIERCKQHFNPKYRLQGQFNTSVLISVVLTVSGSLVSCNFFMIFCLYDHVSSL